MNRVFLNVFWIHVISKIDLQYYKVTMNTTCSLEKKKKAIFLTCYCFKTRDCNSAVSAYTFTGPRAN